MANSGYTSPFPTSHDTIGQSTLATPLFMPSSPPHDQSSPSPPSPISERFEPEHEYDDHNHDHEHDLDNEDEDELRHYSHHSTLRSPTASDLDARLNEYTLDFGQFPSGQFGDGEDMPLPDLNDEDERLSDVGGPEDFTANMEKYLMGEGMSSARKARSNEASADGSALRSSLRSKQPVVEEEPELGEDSEFGPPVDMSTPSHMLHRTSALAKDSTHLDGIDEVDSNDGLPSPGSPSSRKMSNASRDEALEREERLQERITQLEEEAQDRDDQLLKSRDHLLEAASAGEQIRHLQVELQRKNDQIQEMGAKEAESALLRERVLSLQKQAAEHEKLQQAIPQPPDFGSIQQDIREMQKQLQNKDSQSSLDTERLETIAHLRQQLSLAQEQVKQRDATLDETLAKLREVTHAKEVLLREKNAEIDRFKADLDDQALENEKLETELDRVNADYEALEDRLTNLEIKNQPLEERNQSLEADLSRVQSQVEAQETALKAVAADLPMSSRSTYSEILDLIKDLGPPESELDLAPPVQGKFPVNTDMHNMGDEIARFQQELQGATGAQKAAEVEANRLREQAMETQALIKTIESENLRLATRVEELTTTLNKTQHDLTRTQEEHAGCLETITRLQAEASRQPPSPPSSPPKPAINEQQSVPDTAAMEEAHQAQIKSLQTAHSTAVSTLRSSHAESMRKIRDLLTAAEEREANLRVDLTTLRTSVSTQESQLRKSFKSEVRRLEAVIAAKDETAVAIDQRIAMSVDKREREWERRVDLLLKERDRMAKALMMYWGEKEMGPGPGVLAEGKENRRREGDKETKQGQAYRYKYMKSRSKSGERKA
ncbi:hypothetical protein N7451_008352 [Penicillium sp. IBT 35674x]|nr:hypothetical protein N7451_008352 [Penicillium sp. IBT 35674x]